MLRARCSVTQELRDSACSSGPSVPQCPHLSNVDSGRAHPTGLMRLPRVSPHRTRFSCAETTRNAAGLVGGRALRRRPCLGEARSSSFIRPGHWALVCPGTALLRVVTMVAVSWLAHGQIVTPPLSSLAPTPSLQACAGGWGRCGEHSEAGSAHGAHIHLTMEGSLGKRFPGSETCLGERGGLARRALHPSRELTTVTRIETVPFASLLSSCLCLRASHIQTHATRRDRSSSQSHLAGEQAGEQRGCVTDPRPHSV